MREGREGENLDGGAESEASLDGAGCEASRAAGGFGSGASGVGTLSDICLLTAAGAAGWMGAGELEHSATTTRTSTGTSTLLWLYYNSGKLNIATKQ